MKKLFLGIFFLFPVIALAIETVKIDTEDGLSTYTTGVSQDIDNAINKNRLLVGLKAVPFLGTVEHEKKDKVRNAVVYTTAEGTKLYRFNVLAGLQYFEKKFDISTEQTIQGKPQGWALDLGVKPRRYVEYKNGPTHYTVQVVDEKEGQKKYAFLKKIIERYPNFGEEVYVKTPKQMTMVVKEFVEKQTTLAVGRYIFELDQNTYQH